MERIGRAQGRLYGSGTEASAHSLNVKPFNHDAYQAIAMWREKDGYAERRAAWLQQFSTGTLLI